MDRLTFQNPANTDWLKFSASLSDQLSPNVNQINTTTELNTVAQNLNDALIKSYELSCPLKTYKDGRSAPFYTSDIKNLRQEARKKFNKAKDKDQAKQRNST